MVSIASCEWLSCQKSCHVTSLAEQHKLGHTFGGCNQLEVASRGRKAKVSPRESSNHGQRVQRPLFPIFTTSSSHRDLMADCPPTPSDNLLCPSANGEIVSDGRPYMSQVGRGDSSANESARVAMFQLVFDALQASLASKDALKGVLFWRWPIDNTSIDYTTIAPGQPTFA